MTRKNAESACDSGKCMSSEDSITSLMKEAEELLKIGNPSHNKQKGIICLRKAIDMGSSEAMYKLGLEYERGYNIAKNKDKAIELFALSAKANNQTAVTHLSYLYYNDKTIENHFEKALGLIDLYASWDNYNTDYLIGLMYWNGYGVDMDADKAIINMTKAAIVGNHIQAAHFLGTLYEYGHEAKNDYYNWDPRQVNPDPCASAKFYEIASNNGHATSKYRLAMMKMEGRGTNIDYYVGFVLLWEAAVEKIGRAQFELAKFYVSDCLFPKDNIAAIFWAMMSQNFEYNPNTNSFIKDLETELPKSTLMKLQQRVSFYKNSLNKVNNGIKDLILPPHLYAIKFNNLFNKDVDTKGNQAGKDSISEVTCVDSKIKSNTVPSNDEDNTSKEVEDNNDIEVSTGVEYSYVKQLGKNFDPSKIKLSLLLNKPLEKTDEVGFNELKISYNNQNKDRKKVELYTAAPVKLTKKARLLLIKLALQFDTKDNEKRKSDIAKILKDPNLGSDVVSAINSLARSLFPGIFPKSCPFISKKTGELKISLSIDRWMIENAKDFHEVSRLK